MEDLGILGILAAYALVFGVPGLLLWWFYHEYKKEVK